MAIVIEAVYENGVFKPKEPLGLKERETVRLTIEAPMSWAERTSGILQLSGDPEVVRKIVGDPEHGILESP